MNTTFIVSQTKCNLIPCQAACINVNEKVSYIIQRVLHLLWRHSFATTIT